MFVETANYVEPTLPKVDILPKGTFRAPTVGLLRSEDVFQYAGLLRSIISEAVFLTPHERDEQIRKRTDQYFVDALRDPSQWTLIAAKEAGQVVGVLEAKILPDRMAGYIHWVGVALDQRGRGLATDMYRLYESVLGGMNVPNMLAFVSSTNVSSLSLHRRFGFNMDQPYAEKESGKWYFKPVTPKF